VLVLLEVTFARKLILKFHPIENRRTDLVKNESEEFIVTKNILVSAIRHDVFHNKCDNLGKSMSNQQAARYKQHNRNKQDANSNHDQLSKHKLQHHLVLCSDHTVEKE